MAHFEFTNLSHQSPLALGPNIPTMEKEPRKLNRLKVVLAEKDKTNKWLAEKLGKDAATVSKWCTNTAQPNLETLFEIARHLEIDVRDLLKTSNS